MASTRRNTLSRLNLVCNDRYLAFTIAEMNASPFLSSRGGDGGSLDFTFNIALVNDISIKQMNKIVRELPVRQTEGARGTFKEFVSADDIEIIVDGMISYDYRGDQQRDPDLERRKDIARNLTAIYFQSGLIRENSLGIQSEADLVAALNRYGIDPRNLNINRTLTRTGSQLVTTPVVQNLLRRGGSQLAPNLQNVIRRGGGFLRREQERDTIYPDEALKFPSQEFEHLRKFARVPFGVRAQHKLLEDIGVSNVIIDRIETLSIKSQHQLSFRMHMYSDDPSNYDINTFDPNSQIIEPTDTSGIDDVFGIA